MRSLQLALKSSFPRPSVITRALSVAADPIKVFGHKVPDTDTVCSAMVREWDLNQQGISAQAYRLGELNKETAYVLESLGLEQPPLLEDSLDESSVVSIVDTNNPAELPDNVERAQIHSIIDHHKLAGLMTAEPLEIDMRVLCSAGSILYARMKYKEILCKSNGHLPCKSKSNIKEIHTSLRVLKEVLVNLSEF